MSRGSRRKMSLKKGSRENERRVEGLEDIKTRSRSRHHLGLLKLIYRVFSPARSDLSHGAKGFELPGHLSRVAKQDPHPVTTWRAPAFATEAMERNEVS